MTALDLCAARRLISAVIGIGLLAHATPDMISAPGQVRDLWDWAVLFTALALMVWALACALLGRCDIAKVAVAAVAFWVTVATNHLLTGRPGLALTQVAFAFLVGFLHVTYDLSGRAARSAPAKARVYDLATDR